MTAATEESGRSTFSSTWGTVLATAGVAIGLGNVWRFPYMMGRYGGAVFLLCYLVIIVAFGIPALMAEWALGRHTRRGTWGAFTQAGLPGGRWWSYLLLLTIAMAASYYGVVLAWVLYFALAFSASTVSVAVSTEFSWLSARFVVQFALVVVTVTVGCTCLGVGVKRGIERASFVALPVFFVLFAVLIVRVLSLDGAREGLRTFLTPTWENFTATTPLAALGQAFFSLGLGGTFMVVYGSYLRKEEDIPKAAALTAAADVGAALMAGLIVVPAAAVFHVSLTSGPALMFETMPTVFRHMPGGHAFGAAFFASIFLVAMLSLMAAYEVLVAACRDALGWSRAKALWSIAGSQIVLSVPALIVDRYIEVSDLVWGSTMQPLGGVVAVVALAWCVGRTKMLEEIRRSSRLPVPTWLYHWIKFGIPSGIVATLVYGWVGR